MKSLFTKRRLIFLSIIIVMVVFAGVLQPQISSRREKEFIDITPPGELKYIVFFTQALGAFRGLAIDVLWIRAMDLKEQGKFFELAQLYTLICQLEPHFIDIWIHNAWNMAYNISVELKTPEERWSWVKKGISLLRDEAIPLNPRAPELYKELSWIYLHKIGDDLDNMHKHYKREMILGFQRLLGEEQDLESIAAAPGSIEDLLEDAEVRRLFEELKKEGKDPLKIDLMSIGAFTEKQIELLVAEGNGTAVKRILDFLRKRSLDKLKLDPKKMLALNKKYGKLDWRMPEVHGLYWAEESIPLLEFEEKENRLFYDRYIYTAFKLMFERGRARIYRREVGSSGPEDEKVWVLDVGYSPDVRWADTLDGIYLKLIDMWDKKDKGGSSDKFSVENARKNWLKRAVYFLYIYGDEGKSREFYTKYVKAMKKNRPYIVDIRFEDFVLREAKGYLTDQGIDVNVANIKGLIRRALIQRHVYGDEYEAVRFEKLAKQLYDLYVEDNVGYEDRFGIEEKYRVIYQGVVEEFRKDLRKRMPREEEVEE